jgi:acyl-CoA thioesterase
MADDDVILAFANVVMANRKPSDGFVEETMPAASPAETLDVFTPPGTFGERTQIRTVSGFPPFQQPNSISLAWVKEQSGRRMDPIQLTYLADVYPPRIWYGGSELRPSATITMSVYFLATQEEMDSMGDDYVLTHASGTRGAQSTVGSQAQLWSPAGALLATTEQICWFR